MTRSEFIQRAVLATLDYHMRVVVFDPPPPREPRQPGGGTVICHSGERYRTRDEAHAAAIADAEALADRLGLKEEA